MNCYKGRGKITLQNMSEMEAKVYNTVATYNNIGINCKGVTEVVGTTKQNIKGKLDRLHKHGLLKKIGYRYFLESKNEN